MNILRTIVILGLLSLSASSTLAQSGSDSVKSDSVKSDSVKSDSVQSVEKSGEIIITQPEYKGGINALYEYVSVNFQYPTEAAKRWISGKLEVEFTVEKSGDVTYVGILKGIDDMVDAEVLRLLKAMPRWTPATRNGVPVRYKVSMPINIKVSRSKNGVKSEMAL